MSISVGDINRAARELFAQQRRDYDFAPDVHRDAEHDRIEVRARHRPCRARLTIPFDYDDMVRSRDAAAFVVDRLLAFADIGCACEVRTVVDRDPGDEDRS